MRGRAPSKAILSIAAALAAVFLSQMASAQQAKVKTENGVRVVRNPATPVKGPDGRAAAVSIVEDLVIGEDTSREDHWFGSLNGLDVDASGRIYTVDPRSIRIRIFGPDGSLIKAFGRKGQGPGEFSGPGGIVAAPDGTFVVRDILNRRLSYFTRDGTHIKDTLYGIKSISGLAIDRNSDLFIILTDMPQNGRQDWELVKCKPDLKPIRSIHSVSIVYKGLAFPLLPDRIFFGLTGGGRLAWMVSSDYSIRVEDASGKPIMKVLRECRPRKINAEDKARIIDRTFPGGAPPELVAEFPDSFPAAAGLMTDEKGRIYVRTYETDGRGGEGVDVFDEEGFYVARFFVPENEQTVKLRDDKLYVLVTESAAGNPVVKRYSLVWE